ncbi:hypothetical protein BLA34_23150 [Ralstonia solanacearum]|nr:hypothetical protein BLA34_23150 [Ralstonia solanacearum]
MIAVAVAAAPSSSVIGISGIDTSGPNGPLTIAIPLLRASMAVLARDLALPVTSGIRFTRFGLMVPGIVGRLAAA